MKQLMSPCSLLTLIVLLAVRTLALAAPAEENAPPRGDVIARIHSLGSQGWGTDPTGRTFKEIWNLPITGQFREEALNKLAMAFGAHFEPKGAVGGAARLVRPLLNDLISHETRLEVLQTGPGQREYTLAARLEEPRSKVWQSNIAELAGGWVWRSTGIRPKIGLLATNGWVAVRWNSDPAADNDVRGLMHRIQKGQLESDRPSDYWLKVDADLARAAVWIAKPDRARLPQLALTIVGNKENLRTQAHLTFPEPLVSRVEKWEIPTDIIRDPLVSFTAIQGIAPWLKQQSWFEELGLDSVPNQLYFWGLSQTAFQLQAAVPMPDASKAFARMSEAALNTYNRSLEEYAVGKINRMTNRQELMWTGLPILVPYLRPATDHGRGYLHGGIFPVPASTNAAPPQLFEQLTTKPNLVYYDWEITQMRLDQLRPLAQVSGVFLTIPAISTNSAAFKWLDAIEPRLGNAVTEASLETPRELNVQRTAHLGLNGLELLTLAHWVDGTNFPNLDLTFGFRPVIRSSKPAKPRR